MNHHIADDDVGVEVGCGAGLSQLFLKNKNLVLTDNTDEEWVDKKMDALDFDYEADSLDYVIASNMIHHLVSPYRFFNEVHRVLKPKGVLLIQDANASLVMRAILRLLNHEGYDYSVDVFDPNEQCCDEADIWAGNAAIPNLLFNDVAKFEATFPFSVSLKEVDEFLLFPLSGGVTAKSWTVQLPNPVLSVIAKFDQLVSNIAPNTLAMAMRLVLVNNK